MSSETLIHTPAGATRIAVTQIQGIMHITFPAGKADGIAVRELFEASAQLLDRHSVRVVVDMTGTDFVPSGMMGMLITVKKKITGMGGQFHVVVPNPMILQSFHAMNLERILSLHEALPDAISHFKN